MDENAIKEAARARAVLVNAGAACARRDGQRTENPHALDTEAWATWSEGFDQQTAWLAAERGDYHLAVDTALVPRA